MDSDFYDISIIGGGIIGLSTALAVQRRFPGYSLAIIEKENEVARHQTGHNSGVIHSGIYYRPGSLRAVNCRKGYRYLLDFCEQYEVPYEICGAPNGDVIELEVKRGTQTRKVKVGLQALP